MDALLIHDDAGVRKAIEDCRDLLWRILEEKRRLEPDATDVDDTAGAAAGSSPSAAGGAQPSGPLPLEPRDRADAVRRLAAVATFFKRTEPHSPVSYLVQKAMRWADMPLAALYNARTILVYLFLIERLGRLARLPSASSP